MLNSIQVSYPILSNHCDDSHSILLIRDSVPTLPNPVLPTSYLPCRSRFVTLSGNMGAALALYEDKEEANYKGKDQQIGSNKDHAGLRKGGGEV